MNAFPFVVGRGRSGTTLLRAMLDSHPDVAVPDETHFIVTLGIRRRRYEQPGHFHGDRFLDDLRTRPGFRTMGLPDEEVRRALEAPPATDYADAVRRIFALYARARGKTRYADKTPVYVLNLPVLAELFPEARFVHVIRDGRDVALSYRDMPWGPETLEESAFLWRRAVEAGHRAGRSLGPHRYVELRYERLIDDPEAAMRALCPFLDLSFDPAMLRYHERAHEVAATMGVPEARQGLYLPPTKGMRDWRTQMDRDEMVRFEALAGRLVSDLGYERVTSEGQASVRLGALRGRLRLQAGRITRRAGRRDRKRRRRAARTS